MNYKVKFRDDALKEWEKLDKTIQQQFANDVPFICLFFPFFSLPGIII